MTPRREFFLLLALATAVPIAWSQVADQPCDIQPYRGASSPQGAVAVVTMANRGQSCRIPNFGVPSERGNPAGSGAITKAPGNGAAIFSPPEAIYTPNPGFIGTDAFEYEALSHNRSGTPLRLRVRVSITVVAP